MLGNWLHRVGGPMPRWRRSSSIPLVPLPCCNGSRILPRLLLSLRMSAASELRQQLGPRCAPMVGWYARLSERPAAQRPPLGCVVARKSRPPYAGHFNSLLIAPRRRDCSTASKSVTVSRFASLPSSSMTSLPTFPHGRSPLSSQATRELDQAAGLNMRSERGHVAVHNWWHHIGDPDPSASRSELPPSR